MYQVFRCDKCKEKFDSKGKKIILWLTYNGVKKPLAQWSQEMNIDYNVLLKRIKNGWSEHRALTTPIRKKAKRRYITYNGVTKTIKEWSMDKGIRYSTLLNRLAVGWSAQDALEIKCARGNESRRECNVEQQ